MESGKKKGVRIIQPLLIRGPILILAIAIVFFEACSRQEEIPLRIDLVERYIRFPGVIYPHRYNTFRDRENGHHFIVWSGGGNAKKALITTNTPDEQILDGLLILGAAPGDNLTQDGWTKRSDPSSAEPDKRVQGTVVDIIVSWEDRELPANQLFKNTKESDFDFRVGGHYDLIAIWRSGCVTCLFSCPGGRTGNAAFTIRDQSLNRKTFQADESILPPDGTLVLVHMRLQTNPETAPAHSSSTESSD
jgi:hypothetical protein